MVFFAVMSKDIFMGIWNFGVRYSDFSVILVFRVFHPDEAARKEWYEYVLRVIV